MNKRIVISIVAILVLTAGVGFAVWQATDPDRVTETDDVVQEDPARPINEADEQNRNTEPGGSDDGSRAPDNGSDRDTSEQTDTRKRVDPNLTTVSQDSNNVIVRAIVDGATSGTCTVVFKRQGQPDITREAPVGQQTSYYVCQGFDISKSTFPVKGQWSVRVKFSSSTAVGESRSETININ